MFKLLKIVFYGYIGYNVSSWIFARTKPEWLRYHNYFGIRGKKKMYKWLKNKTVSIETFKKLSIGEELLFIYNDSNKVKDIKKGENHSIYKNYFTNEILKYYNQRKGNMTKTINKDCKMAKIEPLDKVKILDYGHYRTEDFKLDKIYKIDDHPYIHYNSDELIDTREDLWSIIPCTKENVKRMFKIRYKYWNDMGMTLAEDEAWEEVFTTNIDALAVVDERTYDQYGFYFKDMYKRRYPDKTLPFEEPVSQVDEIPIKKKRESKRKNINKDLVEEIFTYIDENYEDIRQITERDYLNKPYYQRQVINVAGDIGLNY